MVLSMVIFESLTKYCCLLLFIYVLDVSNDTVENRNALLYFIQILEQVKTLSETQTHIL